MAIKDMILRKDIYLRLAKDAILASHARAYRRFMIVVLVVAIRSQATFLVRNRVTFGGL